MSIKTDAQTIKNETVTGANTALRVGANLEAIADDLIAKDAAIALNTTHKTSDGSEHSFIDQDVTSGASPTFNGVNITGLSVGATQQLYINVRAESGTIAVDQPVYITDYNVSGFYTVALADASNAATMPCAGITTVSTTTSSTVALAISGRLSGLDTSAYAQNDALYVGSGGGLTTTKPIGANAIQKIGSVSRVHASAGVILIQGAGRTNDIPNLPSNEFWLGDGSGVAIATDFDTEVSANADVIANKNTIDSEPIGNEAQVLQVVSITQANYDLITPVATTLYVING